MQMTAPRAGAHVGLLGAIESPNPAVILLNGHAIELADRWRRLVPLDGVANQGAAHDPRDGRDVLPGATADLMSQQAPTTPPMTAPAPMPEAGCCWTLTNSTLVTRPKWALAGAEGYGVVVVVDDVPGELAQDDSTAIDAATATNLRGLMSSIATSL